MSWVLTGEEVWHSSDWQALLDSKCDAHVVERAAVLQAELEVAIAKRRSEEWQAALVNDYW